MAEKLSTMQLAKQKKQKKQILIIGWFAKLSTVDRVPMARYQRKNRVHVLNRQFFDWLKK